MMNTHPARSARCRIRPLSPGVAHRGNGITDRPLSPGFVGERDRVRGLHSFRRPGFTLVEILVVIVIIGILASLAVPAIMGALDRAKTGAIRTEVEGLSQAVEAYKLQYGSYPPDFVDWSIVERHYRRAFPNIAQSELTLLRSLLQDGNGNYVPTAMDRAEALVWALGGFSSNPEYPFTGTGGPLSQLGTSGVYQINTGRANSLFDFSTELLTYYGTGDGKQQVNPANTLGTGNRYLSTDDDDLFLTYLSADDGAPYVYFDSKTYDYQVSGSNVVGVGEMNGYIGPGGACRPFVSDQPVLKETSGTYGSRVKALKGWRFVNQDSFQIISGGIDGILGDLERYDVDGDDNEDPIYFQYPTGKAIAAIGSASSPQGLIVDQINDYEENALTGTVDNPVADNLANFTSDTMVNDVP